MKLRLERLIFTDQSTIGELYVDDVFECYVLEDKLRRGVKVYGETAIPSGTYKVILSMSPRFKRVLPLLVGVPGFDGIRIHPGNTAKDTDGCLLVGTEKGPNVIKNSVVAFNKLFKTLQTANDITIQIS